MSYLTANDRPGVHAPSWYAETGGPVQEFAPLASEVAADLCVIGAGYAGLSAAGLEPLYHDTKDRAGAKFATMDLIGLPWRITVGPRGLGNGVVELTCRRSGDSEEMSVAAAIDRVTRIYRG